MSVLPLLGGTGKTAALQPQVVWTEPPRSPRPHPAGAQGVTWTDPEPTGSSAGHWCGVRPCDLPAPRERPWVGAELEGVA